MQFLLGDQIPVDCEILETDGMEVNESLLTGESLAVQKRKGDFVYSGSDVVAGSAVAKVLHTGEENYATQLVKKAKTKRRATSEMQDAIGKIIKYVSYALIPIGLLLFFIQRYSAGNTLSDSIVNMVAGVIGMIRPSYQYFVYSRRGPSGKEKCIGAGNGSHRSACESGCFMPR